MTTKILGLITLPLLLLLSNSSGNSASLGTPKNSDQQAGSSERLVATRGTVTMNLDLNRLNGKETTESRLEPIRFDVAGNSFFQILVVNDSLRGAEPGSLQLTCRDSGILPGPLSSFSNQLTIERMPSGEAFELVVRDGKTGFAFFNVEGHLYEYKSSNRVLTIQGGRLLISEELANRLGRPSTAGTVVGELSISATMYPIETSTIVNGQTKSSTLPPRGAGAPNAVEGSVPGPDIIVGDMNGLAQFGSASGQVGLGIGATSCNNGDQTVHFYRLPDPDHSVVSQNFYRMSGGATNNERFEQLGFAWNKHVFGAAQDDGCGFGCDPFPDQSELGVGCSDPYAASQNAFQGNTNSGALGSRAWINPFTGFFPVSPRPENHTGHTHTGTSHRVVVNATDLNTTMNQGATYYMEVQYDSPQEYAWCQSHPGQCNMYNNASYKRYNVSGTTSFTFAAVGSTVRMTPATGAWTGSTSVTVEPAPGVDGRAFVVYKVSNPSAGVWHYEYAIHNQNLDRSIQMFSVPLGPGVTISNIGYHQPNIHPGFPNDGTVGDAGFSSTPWTPTQTANDITWTTETFAQNPNANAIRFGTLYNFRFDSDRPPQPVNATVGFLKTGSPINVIIQGPSPDGGVTPTPTTTPGPSETPQPTETPEPSGTPSPTVSPTPGGSVTPSPTGSPGETPTPTPGGGVAQAQNLSTRLLVGTGNNVGIGGFIVTGGQVQVLLRAIGPSLSAVGITNPLADPILELHGPKGFSTITNNNWRDDQEQQIIDTGIPPTSDLESAILATLDPGSYTAVMSGNEGGVGVGLVEIYTLSQGAGAKLANISTRAFVSTGSDIVIAGFILGGASGNDPIIVRGIGPSSGLTPALADPTMELRDSSGTLVRANNNWQDDPAQAALINAANLAPGNAAESAIAETLAPGAYTALLAGANNGTGLGLVEVYDNPASGPTPTPGGSPTPSATPGGSVTPTPTPGGTATPPPPTPTPIVEPCRENFDGVTAPALPPGWVASNPDPGDGTLFVTSTGMPDTAPNSFFIPDQDGISDKVLDWPVTISSTSPVLTFRNKFDTEFSDGVYWDGGVLEISSPNISGGEFLDFSDSHIGGTCLSGCYTGEISGDAENPLSGRMAWSGDSNGYIDTVLNLGPNLSGQNITIRFRFGTDQAVAAPGWWGDTISLSGCP